MTGPRFRELRLMLGLSQAKAAARLGTSERNVRDMEKARAPVRRPYGITLAADFHHQAREDRIRAEDAEESARQMLAAACAEEES